MIFLLVYVIFFNMDSGLEKYLFHNPKNPNLNLDWSIIKPGIGIGIGIFSGIAPLTAPPS